MKVVKLLRILLVILVIIGNSFLANKIFQKEQTQDILETKNMEIKSSHSKEYEICMKTPFIAKSTEKLIESLLQKYENMEISFYFKDINNEYIIHKDENKIYYGASIIKLLEANYLINEAIKGNINLENLLTLEEKHILKYSKEMEKYKVGDKISIKDLISYMLSVSDNTAHEIIYEFIGIDNLKNYALSLGISLTISDIEHFGDLTAKDGYKIILETYKIINENNNYSELLQKALKNNYYNSLNFSNIFFLHKYGLTEEYYNDIGIYLNKNPYLLSVFTGYGLSDYQKIVSKLSKQIYAIYKNNLSQKEIYCQKRN